ncbi:MAG: hypothetical protein RQ847_03455 [Wenzhouxiangellaceae bacterium]|nr:hypothetical protein [Wenzhouxiangellaceae bacterium]
MHEFEAEICGGESREKLPGLTFCGILRRFAAISSILASVIGDALARLRPVRARAVCWRFACDFHDGSGKRRWRISVASTQAVELESSRSAGDPLVPGAERTGPQNRLLQIRITDVRPCRIEQRCREPSRFAASRKTDAPGEYHEPERVREVRPPHGGPILGR